MEKITTSQFTESLHVLESFYDALPETNYVSIPDGWFVAVTDVVQSRAAIKEGKFKAVNMAGVAMITAVMNALGHQQMPYIFGGDGSAIAFAPQDYEVIRDVLARTKTWVADVLSLELRVAIVPIHAIRDLEGDIRVAGLFVSKAITNYAFIGRGVAMAETLMKKGEYEIASAPSGEHPDLSGLSCRWMPIEKQDGKIISMIVEAAEGEDQVSYKVMKELFKIVNADTTEGHPAPVSKLKIKWPVDNIALEAKTAGLNKLKAYAIEVLAWVLDKTGWSMGEYKPDHYKKQLSLNTDYRKIQDGIRMTLSLELAKVEELRGFLEEHRAAGHLRYGLSEQDKAILTCFVPSITSDDHYHFMDGAGGGYAAAADNLR